jgi:hypothetical protein
LAVDENKICENLVVLTSNQRLNYAELLDDPLGLPGLIVEMKDKEPLFESVIESFLFLTGLQKKFIDFNSVLLLYTHCHPSKDMDVSSKPVFE